jgi:hypothetical protein
MKKTVPPLISAYDTIGTPHGWTRSLLIPLACLACGFPQAAPGAVVMDQTGGLSPIDSSLLPPPGASQIFTDFPDFNCTVLEDFSVTSGELRITQVSVLFRAQEGFLKFQDIQSYYLNFFSDVELAGSGLAGDVRSVSIPAGASASVTQVTDTSGAHEFGLVVLDVDVPLPSAGNYWVGVSPVAANSVAGQFFVQTTTTGTSGPANARLANPGLGLGAGALSIPGNHYAYAVTAVPEPRAPAFWILGAIWWFSRRWRRSPSAENY